MAWELLSRDTNVVTDNAKSMGFIVESEAWTILPESLQNKFNILILTVRTVETIHTRYTVHIFFGNEETNLSACFLQPKERTCMVLHEQVAVSSTPSCNCTFTSSSSSSSSSIIKLCTSLKKKSPPWSPVFYALAETCLNKTVRCLSAVRCNGGHVALDGNQEPHLSGSSIDR